jgi:hypothetical protein
MASGAGLLNDPDTRGHESLHGSLGSSGGLSELWKEGRDLRVGECVHSRSVPATATRSDNLAQSVTVPVRPLGIRWCRRA